MRFDEMDFNSTLHLTLFLKLFFVTQFSLWHLHLISINLCLICYFKNRHKSLENNKGFCVLCPSFNLTCSILDYSAN